MNCLVNGCLQEPKEQGFCRTHYLEYKYDLWLDNTELQNLNKGLLGFARDLFPEFVVNSTPEHHFAMVEHIMNMYDPATRNVYERLLEFIVFRGGAKSSIGNIVLTTYLIAMNGKIMKIRTQEGIKEVRIKESFIVIMSETGDSAKDYTEIIRNKFTNDGNFKWHFPIQLKTVYDNESRSLSKDAFWINGVYVLARGWDQQIRGKIRGAGRPSFIIADDLYSEKNVKTAEGRKAIRTKWNAGVFNSLDPLTGKILVLCTIVHEDTIVVDNKKNPQWKIVEYPIMPKELFTEFLSNHFVKDFNSGVYNLKYHEISNSYERTNLQRKYYDTIQKNYNWKLAWPDRYDLYWLALKVGEQSHNRTMPGLLQELFHIIIPDESKAFRQEYFQPLGKWRIFNEFGYNWLYAPKLYGETPVIIKLRIAIDKAGEKTIEKNDNTAILLGGATSDHRRFVLRMFAGKTSERDTLHNEEPGRRRDKIVLDRSLLKTKGYIDEAIRMAIESNATEIVQGTGGAENSNIKEIEAIVRANHLYNISVSRRVQSGAEGSKRERIVENIGHLYQSYSVYHTDGLEDLELELENLGRYTTDDRADCVEVLFHNLDSPYYINYAKYKREAQITIPSEYEKEIDWQTLN